VKSVGNAVARSVAPLLKDPVDSGVNVGTLNPEDQLDILERIPASTSGDEWVFVQPSGQTANRGYVRLGNLDRIQTGDHRFNILFALTWIMKSMDSAEVKSRLDSLPLVESETDEIYFELAHAYVHLTELTIVTDKNAARIALDKAKGYLKRAGALLSSDAAPKLLASIQSFENQLKPVGPLPPDPAKLFALAKAAYEKGTMLEAASDLDNALKQYSQAKGLCEQIKDLRVTNPEAEALRDNASKAIVRIALKR
jgi:hypothetical protein